MKSDQRQPGTTPAPEAITARVDLNASSGTVRPLLTPVRQLVASLSSSHVDSIMCRPTLNPLISFK